MNVGLVVIVANGQVILNIIKIMTLNEEITYDEYYKNVPSGYECWSCSYCGKWTGNLKHY